jgi:hypothetical protein
VSAFIATTAFAQNDAQAARSAVAPRFRSAAGQCAKLAALMDQAETGVLARRCSRAVTARHREAGCLYGPYMALLPRLYVDYDCL